jgi:MFS family permease
MNWLIAARVVQGLGGGGCLTLATVIISDITTLRERPKFLAMGAFAWALGTNIGVRFGTYYLCMRLRLIKRWC